MDGNRFDALARSMARSGSRRQALKAFAGAAAVGLGVFGRSSQGPAIAQGVGASPIKAGPLEGQANSDSSYRSLRQHLQKSGFRPQGNAEAVDVFENGAWLASVLSRSYSGATLHYVIASSGSFAVAMVGGDYPSSILTVEGGSIVSRSVAAPTVDADTASPGSRLANPEHSAFSVPALALSSTTSGEVMPSAGQPLNQAGSACNDCEAICAGVLLVVGTAACDAAQDSFIRAQIIAVSLSRCAATVALAGACLAASFGILLVACVLPAFTPCATICGCSTDPDPTGTITAPTVQPFPTLPFPTLNAQPTIPPTQTPVPPPTEVEEMSSGGLTPTTGTPEG